MNFMRKLASNSNNFLGMLVIAGMISVACSVEVGNERQQGSSEGVPASTVPPIYQAGGDDTEYIIQHASGEAEFFTEASRIQEVVPFQMVMPQFLFHDMYLKRVSVSLPPEHLPQEGQRRNTRVRLTFGNDEGSAGFILHQSILEDGMAPLILDGPGEKRIVTIAGNRGQVLRDAEGPGLSLAWPTCGVQLVADASTARELTESELLIIADSTTAC